MTNNLLPCPFCGEKVEIVPRLGGVNYIVCANCSVYVTFTESSLIHGLIDKWNKRNNNGANNT